MPITAHLELTAEHYAIMEHTADRAAAGRYCGDSPQMRDLVALGYMRSLGRASWCPDEFFSITEAGRAILKHRSN
jgi:hypothetical protein